MAVFLRRRGVVTEEAASGVVRQYELWDGGSSGGNHCLVVALCVAMGVPNHDIRLDLLFACRAALGLHLVAHAVELADGDPRLVREFLEEALRAVTTNGTLGDVIMRAVPGMLPPAWVFRLGRIDPTEVVVDGGTYEGIWMSPDDVDVARVATGASPATVVHIEGNHYVAAFPGNSTTVPAIKPVVVGPVSRDRLIVHLNGSVADSQTIINQAGTPVLIRDVGQQMVAFMARSGAYSLVWGAIGVAGAAHPVLPVSGGGGGAAASLSRSGSGRGPGAGAGAGPPVAPGGGRPPVPANVAAVPATTAVGAPTRLAAGAQGGVGTGATAHGSRTAASGPPPGRGGAPTGMGTGTIGTNRGGTGGSAAGSGGQSGTPSIGGVAGGTGTAGAIGNTAIGGTGAQPPGGGLVGGFGQQGRGAVGLASLGAAWARDRAALPFARNRQVASPHAAAGSGSAATAASGTVASAAPAAAANTVPSSGASVATPTYPVAASAPAIAEQVLGPAVDRTQRAEAGSAKSADGGDLRAAGAPATHAVELPAPLPGVASRFRSFTGHRVAYSSFARLVAAEKDLPTAGKAEQLLAAATSAGTAGIGLRAHSVGAGAGDAAPVSPAPPARSGAPRETGTRATAGPSSPNATPVRSPCDSSRRVRVRQTSGSGSRGTAAGTPGGRASPQSLAGEGEYSSGAAQVGSGLEGVLGAGDGGSATPQPNAGAIPSTSSGAGDGEVADAGFDAAMDGVPGEPPEFGAGDGGQSASNIGAGSGTDDSTAEFSVGGSDGRSDSGDDSKSGTESGGGSDGIVVFVAVGSRVIAVSIGADVVSAGGCVVSEHAQAQDGWVDLSPLLDATPVTAGLDGMLAAEPGIALLRIRSPRTLISTAGDVTGWRGKGPAFLVLHRHGACLLANLAHRARSRSGERERGVLNRLNSAFSSAEQGTRRMVDADVVRVRAHAIGAHTGDMQRRPADIVRLALQSFQSGVRGAPAGADAPSAAAILQAEHDRQAARLGGAPGYSGDIRHGYQRAHAAAAEVASNPGGRQVRRLVIPYEDNVTVVTLDTRVAACEVEHGRLADHSARPGDINLAQFLGSLVPVDSDTVHLLPLTEDVVVIMCAGHDSRLTPLWPGAGWTQQDRCLLLFARSGVWLVRRALRLMAGLVGELLTRAANAFRVRRGDAGVPLVRVCPLPAPGGAGTETERVGTIDVQGIITTGLQRAGMRVGPPQTVEERHHYERIGADAAAATLLTGRRAALPAVQAADVFTRVAEAGWCGLDGTSGGENLHGNSWFDILVETFLVATNPALLILHSPAPVAERVAQEGAVAGHGTAAGGAPLGASGDATLGSWIDDGWHIYPSVALASSVDTVSSDTVAEGDSGGMAEGSNDATGDVVGLQHSDSSNGFAIHISNGALGVTHTGDSQPVAAGYPLRVDAHEGDAGDVGRGRGGAENDDDGGFVVEPSTSDAAAQEDSHDGDRGRVDVSGVAADSGALDGTATGGVSADEMAAGGWSGGADAGGGTVDTGGVDGGTEGGGQVLHGLPGPPAILATSGRDTWAQWRMRSGFGVNRAVDIDYSCCAVLGITRAPDELVRHADLQRVRLLLLWCATDVRCTKSRGPTQLPKQSLSSTQWTVVGGGYSSLVGGTGAPVRIWFGLNVSRPNEGTLEGLLGRALASLQGTGFVAPCGAVGSADDSDAWSETSEGRATRGAVRGGAVALTGAVLRAAVLRSLLAVSAVASQHTSRSVVYSHAAGVGGGPANKMQILVSALVMNAWVRELCRQLDGGLGSIWRLAVVLELFGQKVHIGVPDAPRFGEPSAAASARLHGGLHRDVSRMQGLLAPLLTGVVSEDGVGGMYTQCSVGCTSKAVVLVAAGGSKGGTLVSGGSDEFAGLACNYQLVLDTAGLAGISAHATSANYVAGAWPHGVLISSHEVSTESLLGQGALMLAGLHPTYLQVYSPELRGAMAENVITSDRLTRLGQLCLAGDAAGFAAINNVRHQLLAWLRGVQGFGPSLRVEVSFGWAGLCPVTEAMVAECIDAVDVGVIRRMVVLGQPLYLRTHVSCALWLSVLYRVCEVQRRRQRGVSTRGSVADVATPVTQAAASAMADIVMTAQRALGRIRDGRANRFYLPKAHARIQWVEESVNRPLLYASPAWVALLQVEGNNSLAELSRIYAVTLETCQLPCT